MNNAEIGNAMVIKLDAVLPEYPTFKEGVRRAPKRELTLNKREIKLAVANALRYVPEELQDRKSTRLNSSHSGESRMPSSA